MIYSTQPISRNSTVPFLAPISRYAESMRALLPILIVIALLASSASAFLGLLEPALVRASKAGNLKKVERLLDNGSDPNKANKADWTSLMLAANRGHLDVVKALLDASADPNFESKRITGNTQAPT
ncbi:MAG: ankyrin repeat domain-containing protein, partial [Verrucomicrobiales bacterium]|nr:ankyrin repeat domain-containing protein [Verrucomicrobiales bacterium]